MNPKFFAIVLILSLLLVGYIEKGFPAMTSAQRALQQYDYETRVKCERLNSYTDRKATYINWENALICAERYVREERNVREQEARIELMKAMKKRARRVQRW